MGVLPERSGEGRAGGNRMGMAPRSCPHPLCGVPAAPAWGRSALWCGDSTGDGDTGMGTGRGKGPAAQRLPFSPPLISSRPHNSHRRLRYGRGFIKIIKTTTHTKKKKMPQQGGNIPQPTRSPHPPRAAPRGKEMGDVWEGKEQAELRGCPHPRATRMFLFSDSLWPLAFGTGPAWPGDKAALR